MNDNPPAVTTPETPAQSIPFLIVTDLYAPALDPNGRPPNKCIWMWVNLLSAMAVGIHDQTVAIFGNTFLLSNFAATVIMRPSACSCSTDTSFTVGMRDIRDSQDMRWRLRRNIAKRRYQIILVDDIGGISRRIILLNIVSSATTFSPFQNSHCVCAMLRRAPLRV